MVGQTQHGFATNCLDIQIKPRTARRAGLVLVPGKCDARAIGRKRRSGFKARIRREGYCNQRRFMGFTRVPAYRQSQDCHQRCSRNSHQPQRPSAIISCVYTENRRRNLARFVFRNNWQNFWRFRFDFADKPVAPFRQGLNVFGTVRGIADGLANLIHRRCQAVFEIYKRVVWPQLFANLFASHDFAGVSKQQD